MIGSKRKTGEIKARMQKKGVDTAALEQVHAPIGLFKAQTPFDIAVSILGELVKIREQEE